MQNGVEDIYPRSCEGSVPNQLSRAPHSLPADEVTRQLQTDPDNGLSSEEAQSRLTTFGPNELQGGGGVSSGRILAKQIFNAMSLVSKSWHVAVVIEVSDFTPKGFDHGNGIILRYQIMD